MRDAVDLELEPSRREVAPEVLRAARSAACRHARMDVESADRHAARQLEPGAVGIELDPSARRPSGERRLRGERTLDRMRPRLRQQRRELREIRCVERDRRAVGRVDDAAGRGELRPAGRQVDRGIADPLAGDVAARRAFDGDARQPAAAKQCDVRLHAPCGREHALRRDLPVERAGGKRAIRRRIETARGRVDLEGARGVERDAAAPGELALARARAKPLDRHGLRGDDRGEIQRDASRERPVGDVAANSLFAATEIGIDRPRETRREQRRMDPAQVDVAQRERPRPGGAGGAQRDRALSGDRAPAVLRGGDRIDGKRVVAPLEARREGSQRQPTGIDAAGRRIRGVDRPHERAVRGLRAHGEREVGDRQRGIPRGEIDAGPIERHVAQRRGREGRERHAALELCRTRHADDVERQRRERALERDVGIDALERGIALRLPLPRDREWRSGAERRIARDRAQRRDERDVGDPMSAGSSLVTELEAADRPAVRADAPIDLADAETLDPDVDRQCEARRRRDVARRRLRFEREEPRAQSAHDDAAGEERGRCPGECHVVRTGIRIVASPCDAPDANGVGERAGGAVDLECAAASRDELAHDGVDPGLRGHDEQGGANQRGGAEPDDRERAQTASGAPFVPARRPASLVVAGIGGIRT